MKSVVRHEPSGVYVMVGITADVETLTKFGVYYSTSPDLVTWTPRRLLMRVPIAITVGNPEEDSFFAYPSLIDPDSDSPSFETTDGRLHLYLTRFNRGETLDRDLVRWPVRIRVQG